MATNDTSSGERRSSDPGTGSPTGPASGGDSSATRRIETDTIRFEAGEAGLTVVDTVERQQDLLYTPTKLSPTPVDPDEFLYPVDAAVAIETDEIRFDRVAGIYVRDSADGSMHGHHEQDANQTYQDGAYVIDASAPFKLYLQYEGSFAVSATDGQTRLMFGDDSVMVGARSLHTHPAHTITIPPTESGVRAAVSSLSSALKTTTADRSWPTLRGHPPAVEIGEELSVPDSCRAPQTGVELVAPEDLSALYPLAPLAFYFGAEVVPGDSVRLRTESGLDVPLQGGETTPAALRGATDSLATAAERLLKHAFTLDCFVREEGILSIPLQERRHMEARTGLAPDWEDLYDLSLAEQLDTYLSIPHSVVEPHVPEWEMAGHLALDPEHAQLLPHMLDDLAAIAPADATLSSPSSGIDQDLESFMRSRDTTRRTASTQFVNPSSLEGTETAWAAEGTPLHASKAMIEAYEEALKTVVQSTTLQTTVVCNDDRMSEESDMAEELYADEEKLPIDTTVRTGVSTRELRDELTSTETDFLHYIGHADPEGLHCPDGRLDIDSIRKTGIDAFLFNACSSYEQGVSLIEAGSIAGIVTTEDITNRRAVETGRHLARLLDIGASVRVALAILERLGGLTYDYVQVGDGGYTLTQRDTTVLSSHEVTSVDADTYRLQVTAYPANNNGMAGVYHPNLEAADGEYYLNGGQTREYTVSTEELREFLGSDPVPVLFDGEFRWPDEISL